MGIDLPLVWAAIVAFGIALYVALDGFDLGIAILFPLVRGRADRDVMMNSVAPVWDGNETWLVLGGAALFGAFPLAYAVLLPALYLPIMVMLLALVFRGVAFEFRFKATRSRAVWDWAFAAGSTVATFVQGVALGAFIQGFPVVDRQYAGGAFDWATPFSLFTGAALVAGYAALGCGWLIMRTEGALQERCYRLMGPFAAALLAAIAIVSLWTPLLHPQIAQRWFALPNLLLFAPVPLLVAAAAVLLWRAIAARRERLPFLLTLALFFLGYTGLAISLWPNVVPPSLSIWDAAAPPQSQSFLLVGVLLLLPVILGYTAYSYWVFRGKVRPGAGYH
ncbi:MAG: cytochrome d ubiquinol oxidase subunit II [Alphaproteobacteria bacterium]|nr:cytochrome d ubiquinol oxidase subunit II [Alphaproteobacteria bacterium]